MILNRGRFVLSIAKDSLQFLININKTKIMKYIISFLTIAIILTSFSSVEGKRNNIEKSMNYQMNFQGKLYENGNPVSGNRSFTFSISTPIISWSETHNNVEVTEGLYSLILGSINPLPNNLFAEQTSVPMTIEVDGNSLNIVTLNAPIESDPTVPEELKDGIHISEVIGMPSTIDTSISNEIQVLSLNGDTLFISGSNHVILPNTEQNDFTELQVGSPTITNQTNAASLGGIAETYQASVWQSFLPTINGEVTSLTLFFNNINDGVLQVNFYLGEGVNSQAIYSFNLNPNFYPATAAVTQYSIPIPNPLMVAAFQQYTFSVVNLSGTTTAFQYDASDPYDAGRANTSANHDLNFIVNMQYNTGYNFVITPEGNVGIGFDNPSVPLQVNGDIHDEHGALVPAGTVMAFAGQNIPAGWKLCDGSALDINEHPDLYQSIGELWGYGGDGAGGQYFSLPDMRGRFLRGTSRGSTQDPNRGSRTPLGNGDSDQTGSYQNNATKRPNTNFVTNTAGAHSHTYTRTHGFGHLSGYPRFEFKNDGGGPSYSTSSTSVAGNHSHTITGGGDLETRPKNVYVDYIIKL